MANCYIFLGIFQDFLNCALPIKNGPYPVFPQSAHSLLNCFLPEHESGGTGIDHFPERIGGLDHLKQTSSTAVTGLIALVTSGSKEKLPFTQLIWIQA
jgi:hypothetical protein